jgi:hypothetical protein
VKDPELRALRRDLRALLAAWRRTLAEDKRQLRRCRLSRRRFTGLPTTRSYYRGIVDGTSLQIDQLKSVMFPLPHHEGALPHGGAPSSLRGRRQ